MAKAQFISRGKFLIGDNSWIVDEPVHYHSEFLGRRVTVKKGMVSDLASVPKIVPRFIIDVATGRNRLAAVVHDALCQIQYKKKYNISQLHADLTFLEALKVCGVPMWRRVIMYLAVFAYQLFIHRSNYWKRP